MLRLREEVELLGAKEQTTKDAKKKKWPHEKNHVPRAEDNNN